MTSVIPERMAAELNGEFVVFLIGMRINKWWKVHKWLPVARAMGRMLKELEANPDAGLLHHYSSPKVIVQYWRSFEHLEAYARSKDAEHWPAWLDFNRMIKGARDDVGIWHETYIVSPGRYEAVYSGMPPFGLGAAGRLVPATGNREAARQRLGVSPEAKPAQAAE